MINKLIEKIAGTLRQRGQDNSYDKGAAFNHSERSAAQIARLFEAKTGIPLTEAQAWQFLICLKEVRLKNQIATGRGDILDTVTDLNGYNLLLSECLLKSRPGAAAPLFPAKCAAAPAEEDEVPARPGVRRKTIETGNHQTLCGE